MTASRSVFHKILCIVALLAVACLPLAAQTAATGTINGTVTDASGASIPNAAVIIKNTDTGAVRNIVTKSDGSYTLPFLQSGHYEVIASAANFGTLDHKGLTLTVGQTLTVNAALAAASVSTEVVVTNEAPLIDTQKVESSQTVTSEYISNLPVNGRRWDNFVLLTPNVAPDGTSGLVSYRGISGLYNSNMVDGLSNQQALFNEARGRSLGAPYVYSQDSIKEFQSTVSGYSAEFGGAAGGVVNAITKSGTNAVHGDLFYMLRYPTLNALDPYSKWSALHNGGNPALLTQTVHQQQQFGGSVGGPIIKDKLFYFFTYDGFRRVNPILYTSSTSAAALQAYATPSSSSTCPSPLTQTQCLAAANFLVGETTGAYSRNTKQDIFFPKLDFQPTSKDHIQTSFLWQDFHLPNGYNTSPTANNSGIQANGTVNFHERFYIATWDRVLSATTANSLRFQWARDLETATANGPGPAASLTNIGAYGEGIAIPREAEPDEHRWEIFDVISQTRGKHTLKAGVDLNFIHEIMINLFQGNGNYSYSGSNTAAFGNWVQDVYNVNGGLHYTSFTQVVDPITGQGKDDFWSKNLAAFAEDSWKITSTFTLTAGVRYDTQLVPQPPMPLTTTNGTPDAYAASFTTKINTNYKMFQPRIGFAWNPLPGTVLRGGYGIFYGLAPLSSYYNVRVENGVFQKQYNFNPVGGAGGTYPYAALAGLNVLFTPPGLPLAAPFAGAHTPTAVGLPVANASLSPHGMSPTFTVPYTHSWDLAVEQQLTPSTSLTLSYVGTRGMRLPYSIDVNVPTYTGATRTYDVVNASGTTTSTVTVPFYPSTGTKPDPNLGNFSVVYSGLNTWYNAGTITLNQKMKYGFSALLNYTWAHNTDTGQTTGGGNGVNSGGGAFFGTDPILDPYNIKEKYSNPSINMTREAARSDLDMRERFVGSIIYQSNFHFSNGLARYAANGWVLSGTATENTGFPFTAITSGNPSSCSTPTTTIVGGVPVTTGCTTVALAPFDGGATGGADNTNNSGSGTIARAPHVKRNGYSGPGIHNIDFRIGRDFPVFKTMKLQLQGEAFNLFNHRNGLGVANTGFAFVNPSDAASNATTCPLSSHTNTCIAPYTSAPAFGQINSTSGTLYGARQLQVTAKLFF
jgi:hypothetical protein